MPIRVNIPPLTRVLLVLLVSFSLIYQAAKYRAQPAGSSNVVPWVALTPQLSVFYPWVYATSTLAEQNVLTMAIGGATIFYGGKYLERAWGSQDFGKYVLVVAVVPNLIAAFLYVLVFVVTRSDENAYAVIQGGVSVQAAMLVAFKQLVPEHTVTILKGLVKIRVKHFPAIFLAANTLSGVLFGTDTAAVLGWLGFLTSWTYLRFYKPQPDLSGTSTGGGTMRGDASETFAFAYFWPDAVHAPVESMADAVFNVLVSLKMCTPFSAEEVESSNQQASARGGDGLPSIMDPGRRSAGQGKREEAERRRALALQQLNQRLEAASASRAAPSPPTAPAPSSDLTANEAEQISERQD